MIGSPERVKIQRGSIKLGRFIAAFGSQSKKHSKQSILAKNGLIWTKSRHIRIFPAYRVRFSERGL